jgi:hypothetical protein
MLLWFGIYKGPKKKKKGSPNKSIYKQLKEEKRQEIKQG